MSRAANVFSLTAALILVVTATAGATGGPGAQPQDPGLPEADYGQTRDWGNGSSVEPASLKAISVSGGEALKNALAVAAANGQDDLIVLEAGTYLAATDGPFTYAASEPFSLTLTVDAGLEPADVIIDGQEITRGLRLENAEAGGIFLSGFTIQDGRAVDESGAGGYIETWGSVRVQELMVRRNQLTYTNPADRGDGAGLYVSAQGPTVTISGTVLERNATPGSGGGLYLDTGGSATVSNNRFSENGAGSFESGGGAFIDAFTGSILFQDNVLVENVAYYGGGCAIDAYNATVEVTGNTVSDNTAATAGGGLVATNDYGDTLLDGNLVTGNKAISGSGGGISAGSVVLAGSTYVGGQVTLQNNTIRQNHSGGVGGGAAIGNSLDVLAINNLVADNTTYGDGGGLSVASRAGVVTLVNNTLARNEGLNTGPQGGGLSIELGDNYDATADARLYNNIVYGNLIDREYADIALENHPNLTQVYGTVTAYNNDYVWLAQDVLSYTVDLDGNIHADPFFADPYAGNYRLTTGSPCLDAGDDAAPDLPTLDRAGQPRIGGAQVDMGAYEGALATTPAPDPLQLVGQIGGSLNSVTVDGDRAYVGIGPRLAVLDVSNPAAPTLLGRTGPRGANNVIVSGNLAYGTAGAEGLGIMDISNPSAPTALGFYPSGTGAWDVALQGSKAYVVYGYSGLRIIDISNPANPTRVGALGGLHDTCAVAVSGDYAFVADCFGWSLELHVIDISDPADPFEATSYFLGNETNQLLIEGDRAYAASGYGGLQILDLSDPEDPSPMGAYTIPGLGYAYDVALSGNRAYVAEMWGLRVVDVSSPANLGDPSAELGHYPMENEARHVTVANGYAYVVEDHQGLRILDVSDPQNISQVGFYDATTMAPEAAYDVAVDGPTAIVADYWRGVSRLDVSNPSAPVERGFFAIDTAAGENANTVMASGGKAYAGTCWGGLRLLDAVSPTGLTQIGIYTQTACVSGVDVTGDTAFVVGQSGLDLVDVSTPSAPALVGAYDKLDASNVAVAGDKAYVTDLTTGLSVVDVSNPAAPVELGTYEAGYFWDANSVDVLGDVAYVAAASPNQGSLRVVDVSNPVTPTQLSQVDTYPGYSWDVAVADDFAFLADGSGGLRIFDVEDPAHPRRTNGFAVGNAQGVAVEDGTVYVAAFEEGLFILRFAPPQYASVPAEGGSVTFPSDGTTYSFGAEAFSNATTLSHRSLYASEAPSAGALAGIGHVYEVGAIDAVTGEPVDPAQPYTVTIAYTDAEVGAAIEDTLRLYGWDGGAWVAEPTSQVDTVGNTVTATPGHFSTWAVLGETRRLFLPAVLRRG